MCCPFFASSIIVLAVIASHRAEASAILFTDRAASQRRSANLSPLRVTDVDVIGVGQFFTATGTSFPCSWT